MTQLCRELEKKRKEKGLTIEQLARELDFGFSTVWRWLRDNVEPSRFYKERIEAWLKKS